MALETYRAKRNFRASPEPRGRAARSGAQLRYFVQKHAARNLHYDFRLELDGVLVSWAVPKGPSLDPADKRLAVHVEDHPLAYGTFEGRIPAKQYGAGTVTLWDKGTWIPEGDARAALAKGHLRFTLHGDRLAGGWSLIRTRGGKYGGKAAHRTWLLIKARDAAARPGTAPVLDRAPEPVSRKSTPRGARRSALPATLLPVLATLVDRPPAGDDWIHEIKYDGYRMLCRIDHGHCRLFSRSGQDWTPKLQTIVPDLARLPVKQAWVDGEVVVLDPKGRSRFELLQNAIGKTGRAAFAFFAFDLPYVDGLDLRKVRLSERKARLRRVVGDGVGCIRIGPETAGSGPDFVRQSCSLGLEGAVSKRMDSLYTDGTRSRHWVKTKCLRRQEMVVGGFTEPRGERSEFGALLLGVYDHGDLRYSGRVGTGFDERTLKAVSKKLRALERRRAPFANPPRGREARGVHWVAPRLVVEVAFTEWSAGGALRHPSFLGLRSDKPAKSVVREEAVAKVSGKVALSHPDKPYFPEAQLTKRDIAQYYLAVADRILPHLHHRPLSLVRCPDGWMGECFYQKHAHRSVDAAVTRLRVHEANGDATYLGAHSAEALVALVQWGVIELHPWGSRQPDLRRPDRIVFDFDPGERVEWGELVEAVQLLRTMLDELGLQGFPKTTGGKGLHVVLPIRRSLEWPQARAFSKAVATLLADTFPKRFTTALAMERRRGRIFVDYLRNAAGATAVAPYSVRARKNAPVATPIAWSELAQDIRHDFFNVRNVPERVETVPDPWAPFASTHQTITKALGKRVGLNW